MNKIVLIPDSFKGTMSSSKVCEIMTDAIKDCFPNCNILSIPVADGGEGTVEAFVEACGGAIQPCVVYDPYFNEMDAFIGLIDNGQTAIIEMAACAGITLKRENHNIEDTTTYGVGQLIEYALNLDVKKIIVGLGGSLTNDAACGLAAALGVKFYDNQAQAFIPVSGTLKDINSIDISSIDKRLKDIELITMCDINNPLYGKTGAAYVFSPQKGASDKQVKLLDEGLRNLASVAKKYLPYANPDFAGAGAAGGMGFGMRCFLNSKIQMGIETVLDTVKFNEIAKNADMVISGEGKMDTQSLGGKVVIGIAKRTKRLGVFLLAIVGTMGEDISAAYDMGVNAIFSTNRASLPFEKAKDRCQKDLFDTVHDIMKTIQLK